uniref:Uncharacterized protein n=1 Tax=Arundo donax TaxID=35708 RepID=A0A0A9EG13_ARUDO
MTCTYLPRLRPNHHLLALIYLMCALFSIFSMLLLHFILWLVES